MKAYLALVFIALSMPLADEVSGGDRSLGDVILNDQVATLKKHLEGDITPNLVIKPSQWNEELSLLHWAVICNSRKCVNLLLEKGADPMIVDSRGRLPIEGAITFGYDHFLDQLEAHAPESEKISLESIAVRIVNATYLKDKQKTSGKFYRIDFNGDTEPSSLWSRLEGIPRFQANKTETETEAVEVVIKINRISDVQIDYIFKVGSGFLTGGTTSGSFKLFRGYWIRGKSTSVEH